MARYSFRGQGLFFKSLDQNVIRIRREASIALEYEVDGLYAAVLDITPKKTGLLRYTSRHTLVRYQRGRRLGDVVRRIKFVRVYALRRHVEAAKRYTTPGTSHLYLLRPMNAMAYKLIPAIGRRMRG